MKSSMRKIVVLLLAVLLLFAFSACENKTEGLWENAVYREDATLGEGEKTLIIKVQAGEKTVTFTIKTDKNTVGDALNDNALISGEQGAYGLYIKVVNGIKADYETDGAYWSFNKNGEYMMSGVDTTNFEDGEQYELVYTKG